MTQKTCVPQREQLNVHVYYNLVCLINTTLEGRKIPMQVSTLQVSTPNLIFVVPKFALVFFHRDPKLPKHIWLTTLFSVLFCGHNKQGSDLTTNSVLRDYLWWCSGCHTWSQVSCVQSKHSNHCSVISLTHSTQVWGQRENYSAICPKIFYF